MKNDTSRLAVGVLGLGNMGGAIAAGLLRAGHPSDKLFGFDLNAAAVDAFGGTAVDSVASLLDSADVLVVAVKPYHLESVLGAAFDDGRVDTVISVAAGVSLATLRSYVGHGADAVVRAMPNTAAEVGRSTTALVAEAGCNPRHIDAATAIFSAVGTATWLANEELMHPATAVVGSAPAFIYVLAEALADAAVLDGIPRGDARRMVGSMIAGAGALLEAHDGSPAELKDRVASPNGTTIRGLRALEVGGFRAALLDAVAATTDRSKELA